MFLITRFMLACQLTIFIGTGYSIVTAATDSLDKSYDLLVSTAAKFDQQRVISANSIWKFNLSGGQSSSKELVGNSLNSRAHFVHYHYRKNLIFFSDYYSSQLVSFNARRALSLRNNRPVAQKDLHAITESAIDAPACFAVDWIADKIYWRAVYDEGESQRIHVSNLDGSISSALFFQRHVTDLDVQYIVVHPLKGYLFWVEGYLISTIVMRGAMDGSSEEKILDARYITSIVVDVRRDIIYYLKAPYLGGGNNPSHQPDQTELYQMDIYGENRHLVSELDGRVKALGLIGSNRIYWTDPSSDNIIEHHISPVNSSSTSPRMVLDPSSMTQYRAAFFTRKERTIVYLIGYSKLNQPDVPQRHPCNDNNANCSHLCLISPNPPYFKCVCPTGSRVSADERTCLNGPVKALMVVQRQEVKFVSLDTDPLFFIDVQVPLVDGEDRLAHFRATDFDPVEKRFYFTCSKDISNQYAIYSSFLNGTHEKRVLELAEMYNPSGIAIDWIGRNIYWTEDAREGEPDFISVARLDGSSRKVLIYKDLHRPRAIAVDPIRGQFYWTDWGTSTIERAAMDGSDRRILVRSFKGHPIKWPNSLALDLDNMILYWADAFVDVIECMYFNGTGRRVLHSERLPHVFAIDILDDYLYFSDWLLRTVGRINRFTGGDRLAVVEQLPDLMDIKAVTMDKPEYQGDNECGHNNGNCSHLCLISSTGHRKCDCPSEMEFGRDDTTCRRANYSLLFSEAGSIYKASLRPVFNHSQVLPIAAINFTAGFDINYKTSEIFWADSVRSNIGRSYMNGTDAERILTIGIKSPETVAVDWLAHNIYWSDSVRSRIEVARFNGTSRRVIVWKDLNGTCRHLVCDPLDGYLFWILKENSASSGRLVGSSPSYHIIRSKLDGSSPAVIFDSRKERVYSLAVDYVYPAEIRRLYWTTRHEIVSMLIHFKSYHARDIRKFAIDKKFEGQAITVKGGLLYLSLNQEFSTPLPSTSSNGHLFQRVSHIYTLEKRHLSSTETLSSRGRRKSQLFKPLYQNYSKITSVLIAGASRQPKDDSNDCQYNNGGCSHLCFYDPTPPRNELSFSCNCPTHFNLEKDEFGNPSLCTPPSSYLMIGVRKEVSRFVPDSIFPDVVLPIAGFKQIASLQFDPLTSDLWWMEETLRTFMRIRFTDSTDPEWRHPSSYRRGSRDEDEGDEFDPDSIFYNKHVEKSMVETMMKNPNTAEISPHDFAIDPIMKNIYWTSESKNVINVTRYGVSGGGGGRGSTWRGRGGGGRGTRDNWRLNTVVWPRGWTKDYSGPPVYPRSLVLNHNTSHMFWTNIAMENPGVAAGGAVGGSIATGGRGVVGVSKKNTIECAMLDGTHHRVLFTFNHSHPTSLTLDPLTGQLFWYEKVRKVLMRSGNILDERNRLLPQSKIHPTGEEIFKTERPVSDITVFLNHLYWIDADRQDVFRVEKDKKDTGFKHVLARPVSAKARPKSTTRAEGQLLAIEKAVKVNLVKHPCYENKLNCERFCMVSPIDGLAMCGCLPDQNLRNDNRTCEPRPVCKDIQFTCKTGVPGCIMKKLVCDGTIECADGSDETDCTCALPDHLKSGKPQQNNPAFSSPSRSGADVSPTAPALPPAANQQQYLCRDGKCIPRSKRCDRVFDCADREDEKCCDYEEDGLSTTPPSLPPAAGGAVATEGQEDLQQTKKTPTRLLFQCLNYDRQCISSDMLCNGLFECPDRSDEPPIARCEKDKPGVIGPGLTSTGPLVTVSHPSGAGPQSTLNTVGVGIGSAAVIILFIVVFVACRRHLPPSDAAEPGEYQNGTARRHQGAGGGANHEGLLPAAGDENYQIDHDNDMNIQLLQQHPEEDYYTLAKMGGRGPPPDVIPQIHFTSGGGGGARGGPTAGMEMSSSRAPPAAYSGVNLPSNYDRSCLTGASSSSSSAGVNCHVGSLINPPPSPVTTDHDGGTMTGEGGGGSDSLIGDSASVAFRGPPAKYSNYNIHDQRSLKSRSSSRPRAAFSLTPHLLAPHTTPCSTDFPDDDIDADDSVSNVGGRNMGRSSGLPGDHEEECSSSDFQPQPCNSPTSTLLRSSTAAGGAGNKAGGASSSRRSMSDRSRPHHQYRQHMPSSPPPLPALNLSSHSQDPSSGRTAAGGGPSTSHQPSTSSSPNKSQGASSSTALPLLYLPPSPAIDSTSALSQAVAATSSKKPLMSTSLAPPGSTTGAATTLSTSNSLSRSSAAAAASSSSRPRHHHHHHHHHRHHHHHHGSQQQSRPNTRSSQSGTPGGGSGVTEAANSIRDYSHHQQQLQKQHNRHRSLSASVDNDINVDMDDMDKELMTHHDQVPLDDGRSTNTRGRASSGAKSTTGGKHQRAFNKRSSGHRRNRSTRRSFGGGDASSNNEPFPPPPTPYSQYSSAEQLGSGYEFVATTPLCATGGASAGAIPPSPPSTEDSYRLLPPPPSPAASE